MPGQRTGTANQDCAFSVVADLNPVLTILGNNFLDMMESVVIVPLTAGQGGADRLWFHLRALCFKSTSGLNMCTVVARELPQHMSSNAAIERLCEVLHLRPRSDALLACDESARPKLMKSHAESLTIPRLINEIEARQIRG